VKRKAKEKEKHHAGDGMMLATPADLSALDRARQINAENAKIREESFKPRAGSSKVMATPTPTPKPKAPVNLTRQVQVEEWVMKTGKRGKQGDVAVSVFFASFGFSDMYSPDCQLRHVQESQRALCLRFSDRLPDL
jgi:hypothetical protein